MAVTPGRRPRAAAGFIGVLILGLIAALVWQNTHGSTFDPWDGTYGRIPALSGSPKAGDPIKPTIASTWEFAGDYSSADADVALAVTGAQTGRWSQLEAYELNGGRKLWTASLGGIPCSLGRPGVVLCARGSSIVSLGLRDGAERRLFDVPDAPSRMIVAGGLLVTTWSVTRDDGNEVSFAGFDQDGIRRWILPALFTGTTRGVESLFPWGGFLFAAGLGSGSHSGRAVSACIDPVSGRVMGKGVTEEEQAVPVPVGGRRLIERDPSGEFQLVVGDTSIPIDPGYADPAFPHDGSVPGAAIGGPAGFEFVGDDGTRWSVPDEVPLVVCGGAVVSRPGKPTPPGATSTGPRSGVRTARDVHGNTVWTADVGRNDESSVVGCDGTHVVEQVVRTGSSTVAMAYGRDGLTWTSEPLLGSGMVSVRGLGLVVTDRAGTPEIRVVR